MAQTEIRSADHVQELLQRIQRTFNLTQEDIEAATHIPQTRISRWVRGMAPESCNDVFKLLELERQLQEAAKRAVIPQATTPH